MIRVLLLVGMFLLAAPPTSAQDPVKVDPEFNHVEFENELVRILRVRLGPGDKDSMHEHPRSIAVTLTDQHIRVTGADGVSNEFRRKAGEARFLPAAVHRIENLSDTPYEAILVELKNAPRTPVK